MKNMKEVIYIFCGLSILFILIYSAECSEMNPVDFDPVIKRGMTWKNIIESLKTTVARQGVVVRCLYPTEDKALLDLPYNGNFYDRWCLGGKDYTDFWRNFHKQNPDGPFGFATDEEQWFLDEASFVAGISRNFISDKNYYKVNVLNGMVLSDVKDRNSRSSNFHDIPFTDCLYNANLITGDDIIFMGQDIPKSLLDVTYQWRWRSSFLYNSAKSPDLPALNNRYRNNLKLLSGSQKDELLKQTLTSFNNIKQAEELPVAENCDSKTLVALSEVLKLLEKAGIKEVHSLTVLPENPAREYLCIPVKINAILTYDQLKALSDAVSSASTLSIINFFAVTNCDLKMTDVKPLLEKGLPFYQARCMVIIEFITSLPDKE